MYNPDWNVLICSLVEPSFEDEFSLLDVNLRFMASPKDEKLLLNGRLIFSFASSRWFSCFRICSLVVASWSPFASVVRLSCDAITVFVSHYSIDYKNENIQLRLFRLHLDKYHNLYPFWF